MSRFGSIVAQVAEVSLARGAPRVHRVTCAVDCGTVVNPDIVAQQMESSVVFALSAALHGRIDIEGGVVQQTNFPGYPLVGAGAGARGRYMAGGQRSIPRRRRRAWRAAAGAGSGECALHAQRKASPLPAAHCVSVTKT